jgi:hypothetical protein
MISSRARSPRRAMIRYAIRLLIMVHLGVPASWVAAAEDSDNFFFSEEDRIYIQFATYAHFSPSDEHEGPALYFGAEVQKPSRWLYGLGLFNNSFGQFSQYLYFGKQYNLTQVHQNLHIKLSGGIVHGYKDEHRDDLPITFGDFAPFIVPAIGVHDDHWSADLVLLGTKAFMINIGFAILD